MFAFYLLFLAPFLQNSFCLNPEGADLNLLSSNYDVVDVISENFENWNEPLDDTGVVVFDTISPQLLEKLCQNSKLNIYITQEDITIDCQAFNNRNRPIEVSRNIIKRSVDDVFEEGSGNGETPTIEENEEQTVKINENEESPKVAITETATIPETKETSQPKEQGEEVKQIQEEEQKVEQGEEEKQIQEETSDSNLPGPETTESNVLPPQKEDEIKTDSNQNPPKKEETTDNIHERKPDETSDSNQNLPKEEETTANIHGSHEIGFSPHHNDAEIIKGRHLTNPERTNEESKQRNMEGEDSVKTHESTENKKAGSKDTTILIVLFIAVVVVGALAFGYNFIKKRKQQSADLERVERGSSLKRSFQNLTKPEEQPEKKPLIKDNKEVEMVDMKKTTSQEPLNGEKTETNSTEKVEKS